MTITLCASLTAYRKTLEIKKDLEKKGFSVLFPWSMEDMSKGKLLPKDLPKFKSINQSKAIVIHYQKIKKANAILVVNETKNKITNYIGGNALMEMGFAYILNKKIYLLNPIPTMIYTEEIKAMKPVVLKGNLSKIRK